jgi:hypothetical protein
MDTSPASIPSKALGISGEPDGAVLSRGAAMVLSPTVMVMFLRSKTVFSFNWKNVDGKIR